MAGMRPGSPDGDADARQGRNADSEALDRLSRRIDAARDDIREPDPKAPGKYHSLTIAWRMVLELVIGCAFGAAIGYGLDEATGYGPLFLVIFGALGFAAGVKTMMASARQMTRRRADDGDGFGG